METVERLAAIEEIRQLKARYFRCMDTKDWIGLSEVFTDDVLFDTSGEMVRNGADPELGIVREGGGQAVAAFMRAAVEALITCHHGHMAEIELLDDDHARGIWAMEDNLWFPEGWGITTMRGFGHYHETYRRTAKGWRIASLLLTRLQVVTT